MIALWLGHESVETTQVYLDANLALKQEVLDRITPPNGSPGRHRPDDRLLAFLKSLYSGTYVPQRGRPAADSPSGRAQRDIVLRGR